MDLLQETLILYSKNSFVEAEKMIIPIIERSPEDLNAVLLYSKILINLNKINEAENVLFDYLKIDSSNKKLLMQIASVYQLQNKMDKAVEIYKKCIELYPKDTDILVNLAELYYKCDAIEIAIEILKNRLKVSENNGSIIYHLGEIYSKIGEDELAIEMFNRHLSIHNSSAKSLYQLSLLYIKKYSYSLEGFYDENFNIIWEKDNRKEVFWQNLMNNKYKNADFFFNSISYTDADLENIHAQIYNFLQNDNIDGAVYCAYKYREEKKDIIGSLNKSKNINNKKNMGAGRLKKDSLNKQNYEELLNLAKKYIEEEKYNKGYNILKRVRKNELSKIVRADYKELLIESFEKQDSIKHVNTHFVDDRSKEKHGVFTISKQELYRLLVNLGSYNLERYKKEEINGLILYCVPYLKCGYEGGRKGDKHIHNNINILAYLNWKNIITAYPSDKDIRIKSRIEAL